MNQATVYAKGKYIRIAPKKVAPVMDLVRGLPAHEAQRILQFDPTKAAFHINKVLNSAIANAKNNLDLKTDNLYISHLQVDGGPSLKRGRIVARSRFSPILKRTSHIIVGLSERNKK